MSIICTYLLLIKFIKYFFFFVIIIGIRKGDDCIPTHFIKYVILKTNFMGYLLVIIILRTCRIYIGN